MSCPSAFFTGVPPGSFTTWPSSMEVGGCLAVDKVCPNEGDMISRRTRPTPGRHHCLLTLLSSRAEQGAAARSRGTPCRHAVPETLRGISKWGVWGSVQEILPVERIPLRRPEAGIANDSAQLFLGSAIGHTRGAHYIFLEHYRAHIVAAEAQAYL